MENIDSTESELKEEKKIDKLFWSTVIVFAIFMFYGLGSEIRAEGTFIYTIVFGGVLHLVWLYFRR